MTGKKVQTITWVLQLIEEMEKVPIQYFKKLVGRDDLWEVRVQFASDDFRLLGIFNGGTLVILTNGFSKKTQKHQFKKLSWRLVVSVSI